MKRFKAKYILSAIILLLFGQALSGSSAPMRFILSAAQDTLRTALQADSTAAETRRERRARERIARQQREAETRDSLFSANIDTLIRERTEPDSLAADTAAKKGGGAFLEDIITGKNRDSLVYDVRNKMVYIYNEGDITYQDMNLKADFMRMNMNTKEIYAYGKADTVEGKPAPTRPIFSQGNSSYTMDTITYNIESAKAKIKGVATQEGDGWLVGGHVKKMKDNTINISDGKYTTCDETDHPHFYLAMTKAKVIPGKKVVTGPA